MSGAGNQRADGEQVQVQVSLRVVVNDRESLYEYVKRRYAACWFDSDWEPADLAEAVLEALVVSNENPSPDEYGIEILGAGATEMVRACGAAGEPAAGSLEAKRTGKRGQGTL